MITINVNGLTLCHKGSGGVTHNTLPDVCKTPPLAIPVPYENEAYSSDLIQGTSSVFADGGNMIANFGSCFAKSVFDEPGNMGGVSSGTNRAEADWISHSFDVFFEGKPACRLTDKMFMNHRNTVNMAGLCQATLPETEMESCLQGNNSAFDSHVAEPKTGSNPSADNQPQNNKATSDNAPAEDEQTEDSDTPRPMPCIVILIHGVNDVGEAYQNQDEGICAGLNTRLGRNDIHPHAWKPGKFMISDVDGNATHDPKAVQKRTCSGMINRSPIIPFNWGYKPVNHNVWEKDQARYKADLDKKGNEADLPYDTYREFDPKKISEHNGSNIDNLNNWLDDDMSVKNGGTFANATTNIPDMFGPGASGLILETVARINSRGGPMGHGDWSHPIYQNPHRIHQAYAARRLADLILDIRRNELTQYDTINIVAHSQGTIITMLANMWVQAEGFAPADCVIFNHSPYALENRWLENALPGNQQTSEARQQTLAHFCQLMAKNHNYKMGNIPHAADYMQKLTDSGCLSKEAHESLWTNPLYSRNNFGMVYNYFCPNDQIVSMTPIQGFGWRGIPDDIKAQLGNNVWQRVFCRGVFVGDKTGFHFTMPLSRPDDSKSTGYTNKDVTINAPLLPQPFIFTLMQEGHNYEAPLSGNDPAIAKAAMKAENFINETIDVPNSRNFYMLTQDQILNAAQNNEVAEIHHWEVVKGKVCGNRNSLQKLLIQRRMTEEELEKAIQMNTPFSQHSSIVANDKVPTRSMVYDLAIGQCKAFDDQEFWERLLLRADWRSLKNPIEEERKYNQDGILPFEHIKQFMNKPERLNGMPLGNLGVINDYGPREGTKPGDKRGTENKTIEILQWNMPDPQI